MSHFTVLVIGDNWEEQLAPYQENNMGTCPKEYLEWVPDEDADDGGYWENPNRKWDWYLMGGRWTGFFKLKSGSRGILGEPGILTDQATTGSDQARLKDIDTEDMPATFGVVKDGQWYAKGLMGWWACVSDESDNWEEEFSKLITDLPSETMLTLVDCHI